MAHGTRHAQHPSHFGPADPSLYMLGLPKSRPRIRNWCVFAILTGTVLALAVLALGDLIF